MDAATAIGGSAWTASYDTAGNMTCRAPSSATTCPQTGTSTGAQLSYDNEGQLSTWQNAPSNPTSTDSFLYDGEGNRVQQVATTSGTTTTTTSVGSLEEIATTGATTTTTAYYGGLALSVNGTLSYTLSDSLGSVSAAVSTSGAVTATQLYGPYGGVRYSNGSLPTSYGYTGQRADATTGLDYYGARFYDPVAGQFASADTTLAGGLNRYAYVVGNPETLTDPTGQRPSLCDSSACSSPVMERPPAGVDFGPEGDPEYSPPGSSLETSTEPGLTTSLSAGPGLGSFVIAGIVVLVGAGLVAIGGAVWNAWFRAHPPQTPQTPQTPTVPSGSGNGNSPGTGNPPIPSPPPSGNGNSGTAPGQNPPQPSAAGGAARGGGGGTCSNSRTLRRNLIQAGFPPQSGDAAHHIVQGNAEGAQPARDILDRFGIDINSADNGVWLNQANVHSHVHTGPYTRYVNNQLTIAASQPGAKATDILDVIDSIRQQLLTTGSCP